MNNKRRGMNVWENNNNSSTDKRRGNRARARMASSGSNTPNDDTIEWYSDSSTAIYTILLMMTRRNRPRISFLLILNLHFTFFYKRSEWYTTTTGISSATGNRLNRQHISIQLGRESRLRAELKKQLLHWPSPKEHFGGHTRRENGIIIDIVYDLMPISFSSSTRNSLTRGKDISMTGKKGLEEGGRAGSNHAVPCMAARWILHQKRLDIFMASV